MLILFRRNRRHKQEIFTRLGIKGPAPSFIFGNMAEIDQKVRTLYILESVFVSCGLKLVFRLFANYAFFAIP